MTLISIRIHPGILEIADHFASLKPYDTAVPRFPFAEQSVTRSDVLRQAIALGLPLVINPPPQPPKDAKSCPNSTASRQPTPNERPAA